MLPRYLTISSTKSSCSRLRRPIQPRLKRPSITTPLAGHSSRVTISSSPLTGSRVINGYIPFSFIAPSFISTAPLPYASLVRQREQAPLVAGAYLTRPGRNPAAQRYGAHHHPDDLRRQRRAVPAAAAPARPATPVDVASVPLLVRRDVVPSCSPFSCKHAFSC